MIINCITAMQTEVQANSPTLRAYRRHLSCCKFFVRNTDVEHAKIFLFK